MKKLLSFVIILISIFISFTSCGGAASPKTFNESAMRIFEGATKTLDNFDPKITAGVKSKDLASIAVAADAALAEVDAQIEKMKALATPENGEKYKESVLKSLESLKAIIETGKKYSELKEGYTKSEFNALEKEYNNKRKVLSDNLKEVAKTQADFAKAAGAKLR